MTTIQINKAKKILRRGATLTELEVVTETSRYDVIAKLKRNGIKLFNTKRRGQVAVYKVKR